MILFWRIRYLDSRDRKFKDRDLWLNTSTLEPAVKSAVEATLAVAGIGSRAILQYRRLFTEERQQDVGLAPFGACFCVPDYFEDETGQELSLNRMAAITTGNPQAVCFPPGTKPYMIEYCMAEKPTIHLDRITLTQEQLDIVGYFSRDMSELLATALYKEGPGRLSGAPGGNRWVYETAVSDEEIRSFVTIFRRLYMENELANFRKAADVSAAALQGHPVSKMILAIADEFDQSLEREPDTQPLLGIEKLPFTRKRLLDVYIYTQYAHQPDDRRARQFNKCLAAIGGNRKVLTWLFITELWKCALEIQAAGSIIADLYSRYCQFHNIQNPIVASIRSDHFGIGALEKKETKESRILGEKADELARSLWERAGRPEGGYSAFLKTAIEQLTAAMGRSPAGKERLQAPVIPTSSPAEEIPH